MTGPAAEFPTHKSLLHASRLLLQCGDQGHAALEYQPGPMPCGIERDQFDDLVRFAQLHHVIIRSLEVFLSQSRRHHDAAQALWAAHALAAEKARIATAIHFLHQVCSAFQQSGFDVIVIKSLDHWPDLGSDLDLYTDAGTDEVSKLMKERFSARTAPRSWGDRLAQKWNFNLPGLPEAVEVHIGRLGQTGEQDAIAAGLVKRARPALAGGYAFRVPSTADRIMISTLQRMYRHFNFRLSDIVNTAAAADACAIDYESLRSLAKTAGIWEGVATYLTIVSDFVRGFRGCGLVLPQFVTADAQFGGRELYYTRGFLRIPVMPHSARLYGSQLAGTFGRGELMNGARLSLLPWLATAAAVKEKLTGNDKGIW
jgi:hypothetical protein